MSAGGGHAGQFGREFRRRVDQEVHDGVVVAGEERGEEGPVLGVALDAADAGRIERGVGGVERHGVDGVSHPGEFRDDIAPHGTGGAENEDGFHGVADSMAGRPPSAHDQHEADGRRNAERPGI